jgi:hypothetical protein
MWIAGEHDATKTYKREVAFSIMAVEIGLILWSAVTESVSTHHIFDLAKFLMPFASVLLMSAFGADWWAKEMKKETGPE